MSKATFLAVCVNPPGNDQVHADKRREYILLECHGNLQDAEVQQTVYPKTGAPYFATLYAMQSDMPPRVTQLLIRGGRGKDQVEGARLTVYTGDQQWHLNNKQGETLRVVDKHGKVLAQLTVPGDRCDVLPPPAQQHGVIPPIIPPPIAAPAAFGEVH